MKVLLLPADSSGCRYYRMEEPAKAIRESGADVEIEIQTHLDVDGERNTGTGETVLRSVDAHGADVVVFQRPTNMMMLDAMRMLQAKGVACVVEIDDLLHAVSNAHAGHRAIVQDKADGRVLAMAREADMVTVTTPALLREYARHGRGRVIPNAIPRRILELPPAFERTPNIVHVGWTGSVFTHPHDLQMIGTGLRTALDRSPQTSRFSILGQARGAQERLGLARPPAELSWLGSVDHYLQELGSQFDVGLAPLRDDRFNRAKSWLKPLEFAARGVYVVRSVIDEYESLGIGLRAKSPKDWAKWVDRGITSSDYRANAAAAMRERVRAEHLTEHTVDRWLSAWRQALDHRTGARVYNR